ncbi:MAG TPA: entericidin A/B family lipoprotein [Clostridia bacterium]|nr:entericidin A/B family lipoprotein [Clostridia bacterium]
MSKFLIGVVSAALLIFTLTGCNTFRGAGEDVESVGRAMTGE